MKAMKWIAWVFAMALCAACNYDEGECWSPSEDGAGAGAGGGPIVPGGAGGFGDVSPKPQGATDPTPPDCTSVGSFSTSLFNFTTTVPDDGVGKAGGYQVASVTLKFVDSRQTPWQSWACDVTIKMPLRSEAYGKISAKLAAKIAVDVTTVASVEVMHSRSSWQPTLFCSKFGDAMNAIFKSEYQGLGGQATAKR